MTFGNTRPLEPMKVCSPNSALKSRRSRGENVFMARRRCPFCLAVALQEFRQVLRMREVQSTTSGHQEFFVPQTASLRRQRPKGPRASLLSRHQARGARSNDRANCWKLPGEEDTHCVCQIFREHGKSNETQLCVTVTV